MYEQVFKKYGGDIKWGTGCITVFDITKEKVKKLSLYTIKKELLYTYGLNSSGRKELLIQRLTNARLDIENNDETLTDLSFLEQASKLKNDEKVRGERAALSDAGVLGVNL